MPLASTEWLQQNIDKIKIIEINEDFPKYILENKSKFSEWIV